MRAKMLHSKLWRLQNVLGMRLPIYVVLTKADGVPGLTEFIVELPEAFRTEIFGWSSPYDYREPYKEDWLDEMFATLSTRLDEVRDDVVTSAVNKGDRRGVMLLKLHLKMLQDPLNTYLNQIFKTSDFQESFCLRGIYFTAMGPKSLVKNGAKDLDAANLYFARDLMGQKIFSEYTLGEPNRRLLKATRHSLTVAKIGALSLAGCWAVGLYSDYRSFQGDNRTLLPALKVVENSLVDLMKLEGTPEEPRVQNFLNAKSEQIFHEFTEIDTSNLASFFMPASWFSVLDEKIQQSFTLAYNQIILPSLYQAFRKRINELLNYGVDPDAPANEYVVNPLLLRSFERLETYAQLIAQYEQYVTLYNSLEKTRNIEDLGNIVRYLFNKALPRQFYQHADYYRDALALTANKYLDLNEFKKGVVDKVTVLSTVFLKQAFDASRSLRLMVDLEGTLKGLAQEGGHYKATAFELRQVAEKAIAFADLTASGQLAWIGKGLFDPGERFSKVIDTIASLSLLGPNMAGELSKTADLSFLNFRLNLGTRQTPLTGPLLKVMNGQVYPDASAGLVQFIDTISAFLNLRFMLPYSPHKTLFQVPTGQTLLWDDKVLAQAAPLIQDYRKFQEELRQKPVDPMQVLLSEIAFNTLQQRLLNLVGQSQIFQADTKDFTTFSTRDMLVNQVQNLQSVIGALSAILTTLTTMPHHKEAQVSKLKGLIVAQCYGLLERIDALLTAESIYQMSTEKLTWWQGDEPIAFKLFGVTSARELKEYLLAQRLRVSYLAREMAGPILTLLSQGFLEKVPMDLPLVAKWAHILMVVEDYEKKSPDNTLKQLEDFITDDINKIKLTECLDQFGVFDKYLDQHDYFTETRYNLYTALERRCETLGLKDAIEKYNKAASFFNANLAGRFPFTAQDLTAREEEADPEDVKTFLELLDQLSPIQVQILEYGARSKKVPTGVDRFIKQIADARPLLQVALETEPGRSDEKVKVDPMFRTDRNREAGGENIIAWGMQVGLDESTLNEGTHDLYWKVGAPINVTIQWAANGETLPIADPRRPQMTVLGQKTIFHYGGRWSLLRLMREHAAPYAEGKGQEKRLKYPLKFEVPTAINPNCYGRKGILVSNRVRKPTTVFMRVALKVPKKLLEKLTPVKAPDDKTKVPAASKALEEVFMTPFPDRAPLYGD